MKAYVLASAILLAPVTTFAQTPAVIGTFTDNADNEDGFKVERKMGAEPYAEVKRLGKDVTTFQDTITYDNQYCYRVKAYNAGGESAYSNEACILVPHTPTSPSNLTIAIQILSTP